MNKVSDTLKKILEYLWLAIAIISLAIAAFETITNSFKQALPFYAFIFIALFFFTTRRRQRLKNHSN